MWPKILVNLGIAYGDLGDAVKKRDLLERALRIKQTAFGADHLEVAKTLESLGKARRGEEEGSSGACVVDAGGRFWSGPRGGCHYTGELG